MAASDASPRDLAPGTSVQLKIPQKPTYHLQEGRIVRKAKKKYYDVALLNNVMVRVHEARLIVLKESSQREMKLFKKLYGTYKRVGTRFKNEFRKVFEGATDERIAELHTEYKRELYFPSKDLKTGNEDANYEVLSVLGDGLHSTVVKARALADSKLAEGTEVALKHVKREVFSNEKQTKRVNEIYVKRIFRELKIMHYALNFTYVTRMLDIWAPGDDYVNCTTLYSCTELCYCDLQDLIFGKKSAPIDYETICKWSFQMLEGLSCLHYADIVHRDIKPANILIDLNMNVKLTDFNLARWVETDTSLGKQPGLDTKNFFTTAVVAANYRPFEVQWRMLMDRKSQLTHQVPQDEAHLIDVWSIALVIYELLGLWHQYEAPLNFFNSQQSSASHFCVLIVNQTGFPTKKYFKKLPPQLQAHLKKKCNPNRQQIEAQMYQRFYNCPQDESSLVHLLLQMIQTDPTLRWDVEKCLDHPCLQPFQELRTSRVEKAVELLRYCTEMGGHSGPTRNFFLRKNQGDVFDLAKAELQKEPHWFRPLYKGVREELIEKYKKARRLGRDGTRNFAEKRGLTGRQLKQLARYVDTLEDAAGGQQLRFRAGEGNFFSSYEDRQSATKAPTWFADLDEDDQNQIVEELEDIHDVPVAVRTLKDTFNLVLKDKKVAQLLAYLESPAAKRGREVDFLQIAPAVSDGSSNQLPMFEITEDDPLEERATDGSNALSDLEPEQEEAMVTWLKEQIAALKAREPDAKTHRTHTAKDLESMVEEFAEAFNIDDEDEAEALIHVMWLRETIQTVGEELEEIQASMMNDLLYGEQEIVDFLTHVLDMGPEYVDEESALNFNPKVLASAITNDWIFSFEKQGHLDGARVRELIAEEVAVFRNRVFMYEETKGSKTVFRFARSESRIKAGGEHEDHITILDTETPRLANVSYQLEGEEEQQEGLEPPNCYLRLNESQKNHIMTVVRGEKKKSKKLLEKVQDETGWSKEDCEKFVDWNLTNNRTKKATAKAVTQKPETVEKCPEWALNLPEAQQKQLEAMLTGKENSESLAVQVATEFAVEADEARNLLTWFFTHGQHLHKRFPGTTPQAGEGEGQSKKGKCIIS